MRTRPEFLSIRVTVIQRREFQTVKLGQPFYMWIYQIYFWSSSTPAPERVGVADGLCLRDESSTSTVKCSYVRCPAERCVGLCDLTWLGHIALGTCSYIRTGGSSLSRPTQRELNYITSGHLTSMSRPCDTGTLKVNFTDGKGDSLTRLFSPPKNTDSQPKAV